MRALYEPTAESLKQHQVVHGRMKDSFMSLYQTILSYHRLFILNYSGGAAIALLCAYICYVGNLQASDGLQGMPGMLTLGLVLLIAVSLDGSALVSNRYWRKAVIYVRTGRVPNLHEKKVPEHVLYCSGITVLETSGDEHEER